MALQRQRPTLLPQRQPAGRPCCRPAAGAAVPPRRRLHQSPAAAAGDASTSGGGGSGLGSIRDFIAREAPLPGLDGRRREQPRAGDTTAPLIALAATGCPGQHGLHRVPLPLLDAISASPGGLVIAAAVQGDAAGGSLRPAAPPGGSSYACLGVAMGAQRLAGFALVRVQLTERVAVQALDASAADAPLARVSLLRDRWAYFVRADAALAEDDASGAEVAAARGSCRDAGDDVLAGLRAVAQALEAAAERSEGYAECAQAWRHALDWAAGGDGGGDGWALPACGPALADALWRLSFAPFSAPAPLSGGGGGGAEGEAEVAARAKAMAATDVGLRLEAAAERCARVRAQLAAAAAAGL